jgi:hypothetical protein
VSVEEEQALLFPSAVHSGRAVHERMVLDHRKSDMTGLNLARNMDIFPSYSVLPCVGTKRGNFQWTNPPSNESYRMSSKIIEKDA